MSALAFEDAPGRLRRNRPDARAWARRTVLWGYLAISFAAGGAPSGTFTRGCPGARRIPPRRGPPARPPCG
jgi:hypothetical protein